MRMYGLGFRDGIINGTDQAGDDIQDPCYRRLNACNKFDIVNYRLQSQAINDCADTV